MGNELPLCVEYWGSRLYGFADLWSYWLMLRVLGFRVLSLGFFGLMFKDLPQYRAMCILNSPQKAT